LRQRGGRANWPFGLLAYGAWWCGTWQLMAHDLGHCRTADRPMPRSKQKAAPVL